MAERMLDVRGVAICAEAFGDPADPAVLLVHGAQASMLWWPEELCEQIAAGGRHVLRYDHRDTGRSQTYPPGAPPYSMSDLAVDAVGVLDAYDVDSAHVVGRSMGGGIGLFLALDHAERVRTLTLVTTTTGEEVPDDGSGDDSEEASPVEEPTDPVERLVSEMRGASGGSPYFDEDDCRELVRRDLARATDPATLANHYAMRFDEPRGGGWGDVAVPTLVVQGEVDPWFPPAHGEALVAAVPGASLLVLPRTGHDVPPQVWDLFVPALLRHTS